MFLPRYLSALIYAFLCFVIIKNLIQLLLYWEHNIPGNSKPCFWAVVTHIWDLSKLSHISFEVRAVFCTDTQGLALQWPL